MDLPPLNDSAGVLAGLGLIGAALWKIWLRLRHDHRTDKAEIRDLHSESLITDGYDKLISQLSEEVSRLADTVKKLSGELDTERRARYDAERRIASLEAQLYRLGHLPE